MRHQRRLIVGVLVSVLALAGYTTYVAVPVSAQAPRYSVPKALGAFKGPLSGDILIFEDSSGTIHYWGLGQGMETRTIVRN